MSSTVATMSLLDLPTIASRSAWAPTLLVCVPRAVFAAYWPLSWIDVLAAAERGLDGLTIESDPPRHWLGHPGEPNPRPNVAFLREGDGNWKGRTCLYQQNW